MEKFDLRYMEEEKIKTKADVEIKSVSDQWAVLMVNGPKSKEILAKHCDDPSIFEQKWGLFKWKEVYTPNQYQR